MNSNSEHAAICRKLKAGITIPPPSHRDTKTFVSWGYHPEDMNFQGPTQPDGVCKNRYCPDRGVRHDTLTRGYCEPCASIRKPTGRNRDHKVDRSRLGWGSLAGIDRDSW